MNITLHHRHKQARQRGTEFYLAGKAITANPYLYLGRHAQILAGHFDAGWLEAESNAKKTVMK